MIRTSDQFVEWLQKYFLYSAYIDLEEIEAEVFDVVAEDSEIDAEAENLKEYKHIVQNILKGVLQ